LNAKVRTEARLDGAALAAFGFLALVWGYNWVAVKVALDYVAPFTFGAQRCLGGGLLLLAVLPLARQRLMPPHPWRVLLLGLLQTSIFTGCTTWALVHGGAGKSAVLVFTMPFWLLLFAPFFLGERLKGLQWLAVLLAFLGLTLIFAPWRHGADLGSSALAIGGGIAWALSVLVVKRIPVKDRWELLSLTGWQMVLGSLPLALLAWLVPGRATDWTPVFTVVLLYNVVFATALAWLLWLFIVGRLPATISGLSSLIVPVVGVLSGWLQLGERPPVEELAGMLLIFAGLALLPLAARKRYTSPKA
jgi:drug/metabolite transporter (DMT)-like permease